jgi:hypothetical protein
MKCPICLKALSDVGDGYECEECGYYLEYDEVDDYEEDDYDVQESEEYDIQEYEEEDIFDYEQGEDILIISINKDKKDRED